MRLPTIPTQRHFATWQGVTLGAGLLCTLVAGCVQELGAKPEDTVRVPHVVTADIQAGIEHYIDEQVHLGYGYFSLNHGNKHLRLKLVRVHTEYLANLGPRRHFACVDLADISGDVYDVDFFLSGDPGAMRVTETTVHKLNGQPYYAWDQQADGTWHRIPVDTASQGHLGVIRDRDAFSFLYHVTLPEITETAHMWLPLPRTDAFQTVKVESIDAPATRKVLTDSVHGNKILFFMLDQADSGKTLALRFQVQRREKAVYAAKTPNPQQYLQPERLVPAAENFHAIAKKVTTGKKSNLVRARALYDHVIDHMRYIKTGLGWGQGDATYACSAGTGKCTDFHSYFIALSRSVGIPARFAIGASIPSERDEGAIDGYHCWAEFYVDGQWWPVDISEADKYTSLATYHFGHHPANRFELSRGRDLVVDPLPKSGPINFLAYPLLEVAGKPTPVRVQFSFKRERRDGNKK